MLKLSTADRALKLPKSNGMFNGISFIFQKLRTKRVGHNFPSYSASNLFDNVCRYESHYPDLFRCYKTNVDFLIFSSSKP